VAKHLAKCPKCGGKLAYESADGDTFLCPNCDAVLAPPDKAKPKEPLIGERLGQYETTELIGSGGMGNVYKGRQVSLGRDVAIKALPERIAQDPESAARFRREAQAAAAISHKNIIEVYTVGEDRGRPYIAMEFVEGETLSGRLKREGKLPPAHRQSNGFCCLHVVLAEHRRRRWLLR